MRKNTSKSEPNIYRHNKKIAKGILYWRYISNFLSFLFGGFLSALSGIITIILAWYTINLMMQQNQLSESGRRGSFGMMITSIEDRIGEELRDTSVNKKRLSYALIGRIIALSHKLKEYRYLEDDGSTSSKTSNERGHLLATLLYADFNNYSYNDVFVRANFDYANLNEMILRKKRFSGIRLQYGSFLGTDLTSSKMTSASLNNCNFKGATMNEVDLSSSKLRDSNLSGVSLQNATLHNVDLTRASLQGTNLSYSNLIKANLDGADLSNAVLTGAKVSSLYAFKKAKNVPHIYMIDTTRFEENNILGPYYMVVKREK